MSFDYNAYVREHRADMAVRSRANEFHVLPRIRCKDGFSMSVQANVGAYCSPRETNGGYYNEVEVGFPDERVPELMEYAEDPDNPTGTVYGYVPVEIVNAVVDAHGGAA